MESDILTKEFVKLGHVELELEAWLYSVFSEISFLFIKKYECELVQRNNAANFGAASLSEILLCATYLPASHILLISCKVHNILLLGTGLLHIGRVFGLLYHIDQAWGLGFSLQPPTAITFALTCLLCGAVCVAMIIAIVAGVAYGYNYSMAEWLTFGREDVTVYMRRGQFYEKPRVPIHRRSGADEEDLFNANRTQEDKGGESKPLADTWLKSQDTRNYAEKLTKFSPAQVDEGPPLRAQDPLPRQEVIYHKAPDTQVISIVPNPLVPTVSWRSGSSEIVMRNFKPLHDLGPGDSGAAKIPEDLFPTTETSLKSLGFVGGKQKAVDVSNPKIPQDNVPMRVWTTTIRPVIPDYVTEDIEEDNIVYKPV